MTAQSQSRRLAAGGLIDRTRSLGFTFNGQSFKGFSGDTLAAALIANGIDVVARSFKYHRPRGVMTDGPEEPNAIVTVGEGTARTPNLRATEVLLREGLVVRSQNCWPSVDHDLGAVAGLASPLLGAGFYYKTFMAPQGAWPLYERLIRRAAGLGRAPEGRDPDSYEHRHAHCDVLVIGAGPAGLAAAQALAKAGTRVILCDERQQSGGFLTATTDVIDGRAGASWATHVVDEITALSGISVLSDTTAVWLGDHRLVTLFQRRGGGPDTADRLWLVRPRHVVLATGAIERPLNFPGNDRPGIMLASAVGAYVHRYGVAPGRRAVIHTNNDSGYACLDHLGSAGIEAVAVIDQRPHDVIGPEARERAGHLDVLAGHAVLATSGRRRLRQIEAGPLDGHGKSRPFEADLLCVAGGWSPTLHLLAHRGAGMCFDETRAAYLATTPVDDVTVAGAASGIYGLADCLADGVRAAGLALDALGRGNPAPRQVPTVDDNGLTPGKTSGRWCSVAKGRQRAKAFVDLQNDVTAADLALAIDDGYGAIEHLKRYTTTGMGTDQGKLGNVMAIGVVAELTGNPINDIGHTTFRPPYTPVTLGALAGHTRGDHLLVTRQTPFHDNHLSAGALMEPSGSWIYPKCYLRDGETVDAAIAREVQTVRSAVGFVDMATLGKFELHGPDAGTFLDRVYANRLSTLGVGRCRYALMLREDGIVFDDGTVARMEEKGWHITASTAHSDSVLRHLQRLHQVEWPDLDLCLVDVTEQWAGVAIAGPRAREVVAAIAPDHDVANEALPFLGFLEGVVAGHRARIFRISYSGELAYEVYVGADHPGALWSAIEAAGERFGIAPYGVEALDVMRVEKGHVAGSEIDGQTTPADLGLGRMVKSDTPFVGRALLGRPILQDSGRLGVVGLVPTDGRSPIPQGALLVEPSPPRHDAIGHVTAPVVSPTLGTPIALAMLKAANDRIDDVLRAVSPVAGLDVEVRVTSPTFYDPDGERMRG